MFKLKITIDTKEDSHEEIQKAIRLLSALIGDKEMLSNRGDLFGNDAPINSGGSDDSSSGGSGGVFSMFNSGSENKSETQEDKKHEDIDTDLAELEEYR